MHPERLITLSPERIALELARALEDQREVERHERELWGWFGAAMASVAVGLGMIGMGLGAERSSIGAIWVSAGAVVGNAGPLIVLLVVLHRESE